MTLETLAQMVVTVGLIQLALGVMIFISNWRLEKRLKQISETIQPLRDDESGNKQLSEQQ